MWRSQASTLIKDASIKFGFFGNIHEAGGKATNLEGTELVKAGEFTFILPQPWSSGRNEWARTTAACLGPGAPLSSKMAPASLRL